MRERIVERKQKRINPNELTAEILQDLADFLEGLTLGDDLTEDEEEKKGHLVGKSIDYIYIDANNNFVYRIYPESVLENGNWDIKSSTKFYSRNTPGIVKLRTGAERQGLVGTTGYEIIGWLTAEEIIKIVDIWRKEAAEQKRIPNPFETLTMDISERDLVLRWVSKPGIDWAKYSLEAKDPKDDMPLPPNLLEPRISLFDPYYK